MFNKEIANSSENIKTDKAFSRQYFKTFINGAFLLLFVASGLGSFTACNSVSESSMGGVNTEATDQYSNTRIFGTGDISYIGDGEFEVDLDPGEYLALDTRELSDTIGDTVGVSFSEVDGVDSANPLWFGINGNYDDETPDVDQTKYVSQGSVEENVDYYFRFVHNSFRSYSNIADQNGLSTDPYTKTKDLKLNGDGSFQTVTDSKGEASLVGIFDDPQSISNVGYAVDNETLPAETTITVEDTNQHSESYTVYNQVAGTYSYNSGLFSPDTTIVRNSLVSKTDYSIASGVLTFNNIADEGYFGIKLKDNKTITVTKSSTISFASDSAFTNIPILIQDSEGGSGRIIKDISAGNNTLSGNDIIENGRVTGDGISIKRGATSGIADVTLLNNSFEASSDFHFDSPLDTTANTKYKLTLTFNSKYTDTDIQNELIAKKFTVVDTTGNIARLKIGSKNSLNYYKVGSVHENEDGSRSVVIEIPFSDLGGYASNCERVSIIEKNERTDGIARNYSAAVEVSQDGGTAYTGYKYFLNWLLVNKFGWYNGTNGNISGSFQNVQIDSTNFSIEQSDTVNWNLIKKVVVSVKNTAGKWFKIKINHPAFTPVEQGTSMTKTDSISFANSATATKKLKFRIKIKEAVDWLKSK